MQTRAYAAQAADQPLAPFTIARRAIGDRDVQVAIEPSHLFSPLSLWRHPAADAYVSYSFISHFALQRVPILLLLRPLRTSRPSAAHHSTVHILSFDHVTFCVRERCSLLSLSFPPSAGSAIQISIGRAMSGDSPPIPAYPATRSSAASSRPAHPSPDSRRASASVSAVSSARVAAVAAAGADTRTIARTASG